MFWKISKYIGKLFCYITKIRCVDINVNLKKISLFCLIDKYNLLINYFDHQAKNALSTTNCFELEQIYRDICAREQL